MENAIRITLYVVGGIIAVLLIILGIRNRKKIVANVGPEFKVLSNVLGTLLKTAWKVLMACGKLVIVFFKALFDSPIKRKTESSGPVTTV